MIRYKKILEKLKYEGYSSFYLVNQRIMSNGALSNIRNNRGISTDTINTVCKLLNCQPGDILEYVPDEEQNQNNDQAE